MAQTDLKEPVHDIQIPVQTSIPPPYDTVQSQENDDEHAGTSFTRPGNYISINRAFGALKRMHFIVDPNIRLPQSLLPPELFPTLAKPQLNLKLGVDFGGIDAEVDVLPFTTEPPPSISYGIDPRQKKKVHLKASTATGNITLRVNAPPTAPIVLQVQSGFGNVRVYLPRTTHGPLILLSSLRTPRLSPALRRVCTPLREEGFKTNWFVGDIDAWSAKDEVGDEVQIGSEFGSVWVGYVGEEEPPHALRRRARGPLRIGLNAVGTLLLVWVVYWWLVRVIVWEMA
ncbi:hypothetical protein B0H19DRAFT_661340 [Mycena capillaripes]|nr:hypothetical protein B0H19DRAFT_661340 [Mycena capillaripes]